MKAIDPVRVLLLAVILSVTPAMAQFDDVEIEVTHIRGSVHVLKGRGGQLAVCAGKDGVFLVDDQFAPLTERIEAAIAKLESGSVRFVLNTHWHGDHTGGNENFAERGTVVVAHENVRQRMKTKQFSEFMQRETPPSPEAAWPIVTFTDALQFHMNGDDIRALHLEHAHTDGDAIVHFQRANVLHAGDIYFSAGYPFIDLSSGGSLAGVIDAVRVMLEMADEQTRIIAGHGPVTGEKELQEYLDMLVGVRDAVQAAIDAGADLAATQARKPTAAWDAKWGQGWIKPDQIVAFAYGSLKAK